DEHGQLGEVVAGEKVEVTTVEHVTPGGEAVAVEAGGVADAQGHLMGSRPRPGGPANACATSSHSRATAPVAVRPRSSRGRRCVTRRQKSSAGPVSRST